MKFVLGLISTVIVLQTISQAQLKAQEPAVAAVFKIMSKRDWDIMQDDWLFYGNSADSKDGFIHLCKKEQLDRIINKYYKNSRPLYIIEYRNQDLLKQLKWEPASNGDLYPHLYSPPLKWKDAYGYSVMLR